MHTLNRPKVAMTLGIFFGGLHLVWSLLVALGWGQALVDFVMWAHMVHMMHIVGPFDLVASVTLIIVASIVGFAIGWAFSTIWNHLHR